MEEFLKQFQTAFELRAAENAESARNTIYAIFSAYSAYFNVFTKKKSTVF